jgi:phage terminase large subunit GpA-like protein
MADDISSEKLDKRALLTRSVAVERGKVPLSHTTLTAFIDVQDKLLYWAVSSWSEAFGGHIVAYGTYPDQASTFFEAKNAKKTLALAAKGAGFEGALHAGLESLTQLLLGRDWMREDGTAMRIGRVLIDAGWGQSTETVRTFCRRSPFAAMLLPSHGKGVGASSGPLTEKKGRGEKLGLNWVVRPTTTGQRYAVYDTNFWKTFCAARLRLALGDPEAITLHAGDHDMLVEQLTSEYPVRVESRSRVVDEWKLDNRRENHWWDCLVGSAVAANMSGVQPVATEAGGRHRKKVEIPSGPGGKKVITLKRLSK